MLGPANLFFVAGCAAVAAAVYKLDVVDPFATPPAMAISSLDLAPSASLPGRETAAPTPPASALGTTPETRPPSFDVVRVERDGSMVVAGKASPNAHVEVINGALVDGNTIAGPEGDFAVVVDDPLKAGVISARASLDRAGRCGRRENRLQAAVVCDPGDGKTGRRWCLSSGRASRASSITVPEAVSSTPAGSTARGQVDSAAGMRPQRTCPDCRPLCRLAN